MVQNDHTEMAVRNGVTQRPPKPFDWFRRPRISPRCTGFMTDLLVDDKDGWVTTRGCTGHVLFQKRRGPLKRLEDENEVFCCDFAAGDVLVFCRYFRILQMIVG